MKHIHKFLLAGCCLKVRRHRDGIDFVFDIGQVLVPFVIRHFKRRVTADGDTGRMEFLDVDFAPILGRNPNDMGREVVVNGCGDLNPVLKRFGFRHGERRKLEIIQSAQRQTGNEYENDQDTEKPQGSELPVLERPDRLVVAVKGMDGFAFVIEGGIGRGVSRRVIVVINVLHGFFLGLMFRKAAAPLTARRLSEFIHTVDHIPAAGRGLLHTSGDFRTVGLRFNAAETALLFLASELALAKILHFFRKLVAFIGGLEILAGFIYVEDDFFPFIVV